MTINEIQEQIIEEFSVFDDWMDKYSYLIDLAKNLPPIDPSKKNEQHLINGCQSRVWLAADKHDDKILFTADSDAIITKGIISLLIRVFSNHSSDEILNSDLYFIERIGLKENLSPTRSNGLLAMIKQMKIYALAFNTDKND
jgi:cysteine desulfuration protein SufE